MPRDWDAATYDRIADPMFRWGTVVVGWLELGGSETVLDAGSGSGRVTEVLAERLPDGRVVALDGSPSMIEQARRRLERFGDHVTYIVADLLEPLPIEPVEAIVSTATFHWISDHDRPFANLAAVSRSGCQLAAQCGGAGNLANVGAVLRDLGIDPGAKTSASPEQTARRLEAAGFEDVECWLHGEPTPFGSVEELATYLRTVVLGDHVQAMSDPEATAFATAVAERLPTLELDYVRLNIRARRA
jgi:trans-aconitate 2-methyltransferase